MNRIFPIIFIPYLLLFSPLLAQKGRGENADGNELFEQGRYEEALSRYQDALEKNPESPIITFNTGDAQYKLEAYDRALEAFQQILSTEDSGLKAHSFYNLGNAQFRSGQLQEAVESYKEALRFDPDDPDTKHNLEFALKQLEEQQQNQDQSEENQDKEEEDQSDQQQNQEQQQQDEGEQDQNQQDQQSDESDSEENQEEQQQDTGDQEENDQEQRNSNQENQPGEQEESEQQQQPNQENGDPETIPMTREQADQILEALKEDQRDLLRMRTVKRKPAAGGKDW